ncbi:MAG TPA: hypothetical protein VEO53_14075, partial [Candidatus Binatia bacterium]|nr:hypothetical protein [Candidatus Binatia bacterium]
AAGETAEWLMNRGNRRALPHRMERCGYTSVRSSRQDGLWRVNGVRQAIYARVSLSPLERRAAAEKKADPNT